MWRFAFRPDFIPFLPIFLTCGAARWPQWAQIHAVPGCFYPHAGTDVLGTALGWCCSGRQEMPCCLTQISSSGFNLFFCFSWSWWSLWAQFRAIPEGRMKGNRWREARPSSPPPIPPSPPSHPATHRLSRGGFWIWGFIFTIILLNSCKLRLPVTTTSIAPNS